MQWSNLTAEQYRRLCECRSLKLDIVPIAKAYVLEKGYDNVGALESAIEHLGANNRFFDLSVDEWDSMLCELEKR